MPTLNVIDSLSLPGSPARPNEDSLGWTADCAFVIDGATGIGPDFIVGRQDSDAAWLATFAKVHFEETIQPGRRIADIVRSTIELASSIVSIAASGEAVPAWNLPVAGFEMIRIEGDALVAHGLGDCLLYLQHGDGATVQHTAMPGSAAAERQKAAKLLAAENGLKLGARLADSEVFTAGERQRRALYNTPESGIWTLGTSRAAADHIATAAMPAPPACGLLCTDGFASLVTDYGRYEAGTLVDAARRHGLEELSRQLREIELAEDPDGRMFPRMKRSDDASAILFEIAA